MDSSDRGFGTTHWSVVLAAREPSPDAQPALDWLCRTYWNPVYSHIRRLGNAPETAYELTQDFFADLLQRGGFAMADPARGRLRSFLCTAIENFLHRRHRDATTLKRGRGVKVVSLDADVAETGFRAEPMTELTPDRAYDRKCAQALIAAAFSQLRDELDAEGRVGLFDRLRSHLWMDGDPGSYEQLAVVLEMNPATLRVTVMRLRVRLAECLYGMVKRTVANPEEVHEEFRYLIRAFDP